MVTVLDIKTGDPKQVPNEEVHKYVLSGKWRLPPGGRIPVTFGTGKIHEIPSEKALEAFKYKATYANAARWEKAKSKKDFGSGWKNFTAAATLGVMSGATLSLSNAAGVASGAIEARELQGLKDNQKLGYYGGEVLGFLGATAASLGQNVAPSLVGKAAVNVSTRGAVNLMTKKAADEAVKQGIARQLITAAPRTAAWSRDKATDFVLRGGAATAGRMRAGKIAGGMAEGATDMFLWSVGEKITEATINAKTGSPQKSAGTILGEITLGTLFGSVGGGAFPAIGGGLGATKEAMGEAVPKLWSAMFGDPLNPSRSHKLVADRLVKEHGGKIEDRLKETAMTPDGSLYRKKVDEELLETQNLLVEFNIAKERLVEDAAAIDTMLQDDLLGLSKTIQEFLDSENQVALALKDVDQTAYKKKVAENERLANLDLKDQAREIKALMKKRADEISGAETQLQETIDVYNKQLANDADLQDLNFVSERNRLADQDSVEGVVKTSQRHLDAVQRIETAVQGTDKTNALMKLIEPGSDAVKGSYAHDIITDLYEGLTKVRENILGKQGQRTLVSEAEVTKVLDRLDLFEERLVQEMERIYKLDTTPKPGGATDPGSRAIIEAQPLIKTGDDRADAFIDQLLDPSTTSISPAKVDQQPRSGAAQVLADDGIDPDDYVAALLMDDADEAQKAMQKVLADAEAKKKAVPTADDEIDKLLASDDPLDKIFAPDDSVPYAKLVDERGEARYVEQGYAAKADADAGIEYIPNPGEELKHAQKVVAKQRAELKQILNDDLRSQATISPELDVELKRALFPVIDQLRKDLGHTIFNRVARNQAQFNQRGVLQEAWVLMKNIQSHKGFGKAATEIDSLNLAWQRMMEARSAYQFTFGAPKRLGTDKLAFKKLQTFIYRGVNDKDSIVQQLMGNKKIQAEFLSSTASFAQVAKRLGLIDDKAAKSLVDEADNLRRINRESDDLLNGQKLLAMVRSTDKIDERGYYLGGTGDLDPYMDPRASVLRDDEATLKMTADIGDARQSVDKAKDALKLAERDKLDLGEQGLDVMRERRAGMAQAASLDDASVAERASLEVRQQDLQARRAAAESTEAKADLNRKQIANMYRSQQDNVASQRRGAMDAAPTDYIPKLPREIKGTINDLRTTGTTSAPGLVTFQAGGWQAAAAASIATTSYIKNLINRAAPEARYLNLMASYDIIQRGVVDRREIVKKSLEDSLKAKKKSKGSAISKILAVIGSKGEFNPLLDQSDKSEFEQATARLDEIQSNPQLKAQLLEESVQQFREYMPETAQALMMKCSNILNYVHSVIPRAPASNFTALKPRPYEPADSELFKFERLVGMASDWKTSLQNGLATHSITPSEVEAFKQCHPEIYEDIINDYFEYSQSMNEPVSRDTELVWSVVVGPQIDQSMTPEYVTTMAASFKTGEPAQPNPQSAALKKVPQSHMTPSQMRYT